MLGKALVAQGDCAGAGREMDAFTAQPEVKDAAKAGARQLLATCKPGVKQRP
jgi:hypothetical protein